MEGWLRIVEDNLDTTKYIPELNTTKVPAHGTSTGYAQDTGRIACKHVGNIVEHGEDEENNVF